MQCDFYEDMSGVILPLLDYFLLAVGDDSVSYMRLSVPK